MFFCYSEKLFSVGNRVVIIVKIFVIKRGVFCKVFWYIKGCDCVDYFIW